MLRVDVTKRFSQVSIEASFDSAGGVTALFGRSGAGKTSIISMIAGLLRPDRGAIALDGETLDDTAAGIHLPAWRRRRQSRFAHAACCGGRGWRSLTPDQTRSAKPRRRPAQRYGPAAR